MYIGQRNLFTSPSLFISRNFLRLTFSSFTAHGIVILVPWAVLLDLLSVSRAAGSK